MLSPHASSSISCIPPFIRRLVSLVFEQRLDVDTDYQVLTSKIRPRHSSQYKGQMDSLRPSAAVLARHSIKDKFMARSDPPPPHPTRPRPRPSLSLRANLHDTTQDLRPSALIPNYPSGSLWTGERAATTLDAGRNVKTGGFGAYTGAGGLAKSTGAESTDIFAQPDSTSMRPPVFSSASANKNQFAGTQAFGAPSASRSASYQGSAASQTITNEGGEGDAS